MYYAGSNCNQTYDYCRTVDWGHTTCCGDNHQYYQIYSTISNAIEMWWQNGTAGPRYKIDTTAYDPTDNCGRFCINYWPGPWQHQFSGEVHKVGDLMPGSSSYKTSFTTIAYAPNSWNGTGSPSYQELGDLTSGSQLYSDSAPPWCNEVPSNTDKSSLNIWNDDSSC